MLYCSQVSTKQLKHFRSLPGQSCDQGCKSSWDFHAVLKSRFRRVRIRKSNIVLNLIIVETQHHSLADPTCCEVHWIKTYPITINYKSYSLRNRDQINFDQASVQAGTLRLQPWTSEVLITCQNGDSSPIKQAVTLKKRSCVSYLVLFRFSQKGNMYTKELFYFLLGKSRSSGTKLLDDRDCIHYSNPKILIISATWIKSIFPYF